MFYVVATTLSKIFVSPKMDKNCPNLHLVTGKIEDKQTKTKRGNKFGSPM
jgi:hypothetical protein